MRERHLYWLFLVVRKISVLVASQPAVHSPMKEHHCLIEVCQMLSLNNDEDQKVWKLPILTLRVLCCMYLRAFLAPPEVDREE